MANSSSLRNINMTQRRTGSEVVLGAGSQFDSTPQPPYPRSIRIPGHSQPSGPANNTTNAGAPASGSRDPVRRSHESLRHPIKLQPQLPSETLRQVYDATQASRWVREVFLSPLRPTLTSTQSSVRMPVGVRTSFADSSDARNYWISAGGERTTVRQPAAAQRSERSSSSRDAGK